MSRESMAVDVLIVGAGPAGLAAACRLGQLARDNAKALSICVVEKGAEVGAHILSGAVFEPRALTELFPDWAKLGAPLHTPVNEDLAYYLPDAQRAIKIPQPLLPATLHNRGNYIISLSNLCRWLAQQAEKLGVEIYPGFAASEILYHADGRVKGIATGDMGIAADGARKSSYTPGIELHASYTLFAEGCHGHLGKQLMQRFDLRQDCEPQHYGLGIKELWHIEPQRHRPGLVLHSLGWPLNQTASQGGAFLYHLENNQIALGLITDLNYSNPYLNPYAEFQRFKHHPLIARQLEGGTRLSYGARAIAKGGIQSLPKMSFPGGLLIGCDAGTLNFAKIKGSHTAMKSGMVAAETAFASLASGQQEHLATLGFDAAFRTSWAYAELYQQRNFGPAQHRFGNLLGSAYAFLDLNILRGKTPWTLRDPSADHTRLRPAREVKPLEYPKPDGQLSFDLMSSVFLSNTQHEENQPSHLQLKQPEVPLRDNLPVYDEPAQRYCPAGVYEIIQVEGIPRFQINAQNCVHCKTCDIKDPAQNIVWVVPEGGGGPNYPNM